MGLKPTKWITEKEFENMEPGTQMQTRFMGKAESISLDENGEQMLVKFLNGPWKDRELKLIRQQIARIL